MPESTALFAFVFLQRFGDSENGATGGSSLDREAGKCASKFA